MRLKFIQLFVCLLVATLATGAEHRMKGQASYYAQCLAGTLTSTGEFYSPSKLTAAHRTLPLGTIVDVTSRATGRVVRVLINDRGPFHPRFILDLSYAAAKRIGVHAAHDRHVTLRIVHTPTKKRLFPAPKVRNAEQRRRYVYGSCTPRRRR